VYTNILILFIFRKYSYMSLFNIHFYITFKMKLYNSCVAHFSECMSNVYIVVGDLYC